MQTHVQQGGRGYAINDGNIVTGEGGGHGIAAFGYTDLRDNTHLAPDTRNHDFIYVNNSDTGSSTTAADGAHGIFATHSRGSRVVAENSGPISVSGADEIGLFAASSGGKIIMENEPCRLWKGYGPDRTIIWYPTGECEQIYEDRIANYPEGANVEGLCNPGDPASLCERTYDGGRVVAVNHGDIIASGPRGVGIRAESRVCDRLGDRPHRNPGCTHAAGTHAGGTVEVFKSGNITVTGANESASIPGATAGM